MGRPLGVQIIRRPRKDGTVTYSLRVRTDGSEGRVALGNTSEGWDEGRVQQARRQLLAKIELGQWAPDAQRGRDEDEQEPTFRELATDWLEARKQNPAIRPSTLELNESQLKRYLAPFFGELLPSQITVVKIKHYREQIHRENAQIRLAAERGAPLRDPRTARPLRTLSNESINKTLRTLALILDDAEDAGWIDRNPARGRRIREPLERRRPRGTLDPDELLDLLAAAGELDATRRQPETLHRARQVRSLRDDHGIAWAEVAKQVGVAPSTAFHLYRLNIEESGVGVRRAIIATLALGGPRVTELCMLNNVDVDLTKARFYVADAKTEAGVRTVDIHPRLLDELASFRASHPPVDMTAPAFPTQRGSRRNKDNVRLRVIAPAVRRANENRVRRGVGPIRAHVTPHTFRRTYITYAIAAGFDIPYVQAQVGHSDPGVTLAVYAQVIRRADRDQLRAEIRQLLGVDQPPPEAVRPHASVAPPQRSRIGSSGRLGVGIKAPKGPNRIP